jgi:hypothetical protein
MHGYRERRLNCRLYVESQGDAEILKKLDRLINERQFPNQTELIKHGIELVYMEIYGQDSDVVLSEAVIQTLADAVAGKVKPELRQIVSESETKILAGIDAVRGKVVTGAPVEETGFGIPATEFDDGVVVSDEQEPSSEKEPELPSGVCAFLQGLNAE